MCIKKVEAWAFGDKTYDHEIDATKAAIESIIGNLGVAKVVFEKADKLLPLLGRYAELRPVEQVKKAPPGKPEKDPSPEAPPMPPAAVRDLLADTFRRKGKADKLSTRKIITDAGYADLTDLITHASDSNVNALLAKLVDNRVGGATLDAQGHDGACRSRVTGFEADCGCGVLIHNRALYGSEPLRDQGEGE